MWPTSMVLTTSRGFPQAGQPSPSTTLRSSWNSAWKCSSGVTPAMWNPSTLAPVTMFRRPFSAWSARMRRPETPTGPRLPTGQPMQATTSSAVAGRKTPVPTTLSSFISLREWSPRRRITTGVDSTM